MIYLKLKVLNKILEVRCEVEPVGGRVAEPIGTYTLASTQFGNSAPETICSRFVKNRYSTWFTEK